MTIQTHIQISYLPGLEPAPGYLNNFYSVYKIYEKPSKPVLIKTQADWESNLTWDYFNQTIQSSTQQVYELKFSTTESIGIELIERAGIVNIFPTGAPSFRAYNISLTPEYKKAVNQYVYTLTFTKDNERNYISYLASDDVKLWEDLSASNYANRVVFTSNSTSYTARSAGVNGTITTFDYNFKFAVNTETAQIAAADKFYAIINGAQIWAVGVTQDYRCSVVYIDSDYIYFKFDTIPIATFTEREINISSEPYGDSTISVPTTNDFDGEIFTLIKTKLSESVDLGSKKEQIPGLANYSNLKMWRHRKALVYLKSAELYLYEKLLMCKPENVYFSEIDHQGNETKYYPISMVELITPVSGGALKDLYQFEIDIIYNNTPVNVNRPVV